MLGIVRNKPTLGETYFESSYDELKEFIEGNKNSANYYVDNDRTQSKYSLKLKKTNKKIDNYIQSDVPLIPQLSRYFFNKRGKQLRPVLCLLSSKMINKEYSKLTSDISMAAALEFIHAATLLHDDVIDKVKYISPVPNGIGPITVSILLKNLVKKI